VGLEEWQGAVERKQIPSSFVFLFPATSQIRMLLWLSQKNP
jgi:hypothetical protein